jgi:DNA-binding XRE family transcriptional regulator
MAPQKTVGQTLKNARRRKHLTQAELAKKVDVHPNTIARLERGVQKPTLATAKSLAKALDLNITDIPA